MPSYSSFSGPTGAAAPFLVAIWSYTLAPTVNGVSPGVWRVPYSKGGSVTFTLARANLRCESVPGSGSAVVRIQKSVAGGAFVPVDLCTLTLAAPSLEVSTTTFAATVSSGDLLRLTWDTVLQYTGLTTIQLEGTS